MLVDPLIASVVGFLLTFLIALVGWFARHNYQRLEADLATERRDRIADVEKLEKDFRDAQDRMLTATQIHRQEMRQSIDGVGERLATLRDMVLSDCINHERMTTAMQPLVDRLVEIRSDFKDIYMRLERKQDKPNLGGE